MERLCTRLADRVTGNGYEEPKITKEWRDAARLMIDADGRREDQIGRAIDWCQANEFWRKNVRSMPKLREQYIRLQMEADDERKKLAACNGHAAAGAPGPERARGWMDAGRSVQQSLSNPGRELPA